MITVRTYRIIYFRAQWSGVGPGVCYSAQMETRWILGPMAVFVTDLDKSWGYPCAFGVLALPEQPLRYSLCAAVAQQQLAEGCAAHAFIRWGEGGDCSSRAFRKRGCETWGAHLGSGADSASHHRAQQSLSFRCRTLWRRVLLTRRRASKHPCRSVWLKGHDRARGRIRVSVTLKIILFKSQWGLAGGEGSQEGRCSWVKPHVFPLCLFGFSWDPTLLNPVNTQKKREWCATHL